MASAVTGAGRQLGAVLGTALLIAIVGEPQTLAAAGRAADDAYVFGITTALLSGAVALRLTSARSARALRRERLAVAADAAGG